MQDLMLIFGSFFISVSGFMTAFFYEAHTSQVKHCIESGGWNAEQKRKAGSTIMLVLFFSTITLIAFFYMLELTL